MNTPLCEWCGAPATTTVLVQPTQYVYKNRVKIPTQFAIWSRACAACAQKQKRVPGPSVVRAPKAAQTRRFKAAHLTMFDCEQR